MQNAGSMETCFSPQFVTTPKIPYRSLSWSLSNLYSLCVKATQQSFCQQGRIKAVANDMNPGSWIHFAQQRCCCWLLITSTQTTRAMSHTQNICLIMRSSKLEKATHLRRRSFKKSVPPSCRPQQKRSSNSNTLCCIKSVHQVSP